VASGPFPLRPATPNYLVVTAEIAVLPLAFGLREVALIFSLLNVAVLAIRIKAEGKALQPAAAGPRGEE
jgi:isoprenylcysteine carboxyl methyltransferase (ICMT) family protein YpbQ